MASPVERRLRVWRSGLEYLTDLDASRRNGAGDLRGLYRLISRPVIFAGRTNENGQVSFTGPSWFAPK
jgi:hypothetical protein